VGAEPESPVLASPIDLAAPAALRLWRVAGEVGAVAKDRTAKVQVRDDSDKSYSFKFSGHDDILARVNPLFAYHGILPVMTVISESRNGNMTSVTADVAFICPDRPDDRVTHRVLGQGTDKNDKGAAKASTDAMKTAVKKALSITSVEDEGPAVEHVEDGAGAKVAAAEARVASTVQKWAAAYKAALEGAKTLKDLERIKRDNKAQLDDEALPNVTLVFMNDLYARRHGELETAEAPV
jgi:hypothetical protein